MTQLEQDELRERYPGSPMYHGMFEGIQIGFIAAAMIGIAYAWAARRRIARQTLAVAIPIDEATSTS
jgi:hypothetical protein